MERSLSVSNTRDRLMLVFTEPEGQDFWLKPGESVELKADVESPDCEFEIEGTDEGITVWPLNGMHYIVTYSGDNLLVVGYQRPVDWPSGFE